MNFIIISDIPQAAAAMAKQLEELKEAADRAKLGQGKSDSKADVEGHKAAEAKRMVGLDIFLVCSFWFFQ